MNVSHLSDAALEAEIVRLSSDGAYQGHPTMSDELRERIRHVELRYAQAVVRSFVKALKAAKASRTTDLQVTFSSPSGYRQTLYVVPSLDTETPDFTVSIEGK